MSTQRNIRKSIQHLGVAAVVAAASSVALAPFATASDSATTVEHVWKVDMRGKPPYKRERVAVPVVDVAAMEVDAGYSGEYSGEMVTVWERETSGRPPFQRQRVEVPVVDAASMELTEEPEPSTDFRGRPPFKRHR